MKAIICHLLMKIKIKYVRSMRTNGAGDEFWGT